MVRWHVTRYRYMYILSWCRWQRVLFEVVVLLHIPLQLPGLTLPPKELCGHHQWGAATDVVPWTRQEVFVQALFFFT